MPGTVLVPEAKTVIKWSKTPACGPYVSESRQKVNNINK